MRLSPRMWQCALRALDLADTTNARRLAARRRFRRLLIEQFEDRRVLATANDDEYSTPMGQMLTVEGLGTWGNDNYNASFSAGIPARNTPTSKVNLYARAVGLAKWGYATGSFSGHALVSPIDTGVYEYDGNNNPHSIGFAFTYSPTPGFQGFDSFTYSLSDDEGGDDATVTIRVGSQPNAIADAYSVAVGSSLTIDAALGVLANDYDADDEPLTAVLVADVENGELTLQGDGSFIYTPDQNHHGWDSFSYYVQDGGPWQSESTIVFIHVDVPPTVQDDSYTAAQDSPLIVSTHVGVLANDEVFSGSSMEVYSVVEPTHGSLTWNADGSFVYSPSSEYTGPDSFTYHARSGAAVSTAATVTLNVVPVSAALQAIDDTYSTPSGDELVINAAGGRAGERQQFRQPDGVSVEPAESWDGGVSARWQFRVSSE